MAHGHQLTYDRDNLFAKFVDGRIPVTKVFESDHSIAVLDAFPSTKYHTLLISKVGKVAITDFTPEECAGYLGDVATLSNIVQEAAECDGVNILSSAGPAANQGVFHAHFHIIPRHHDMEKDCQLKHPASLGRIPDEWTEECVARMRKVVASKH